MKIEDIVIAAGSIQKLIDQDVPLCTAWALKKLLDRGNPVLEFYGQELAKYGEAPDAESRRAQLLALTLPDFDGFARVAVPLDVPVKLSAADIKRLEPFVQFCEPVSNLDTEKERPT